MLKARGFCDDCNNILIMQEDTHERGGLHETRLEKEQRDRYR